MKNAHFPPALQSFRLLDQVCERIRHCHYSLRTEIYTHVLKDAAAGVPSPLDSLRPSISPLHCSESCSEQMNDPLCIPWMNRWTTAAPVAVYR
ncbi:MAG: hypothetical protein ABJA83_14490 [Burkholderiaceae bacterium]